MFSDAFIVWIGENVYKGVLHFFAKGKQEGCGGGVNVQNVA